MVLAVVGVVSLTRDSDGGDGDGAPQSDESREPSFDVTTASIGEAGQVGISSESVLEGVGTLLATQPQSAAASVAATANFDAGVSLRSDDVTESATSDTHARSSSDPSVVTQSVTTRSTSAETATVTPPESSLVILTSIGARTVSSPTTVGVESAADSTEVAALRIPAIGLATGQPVESIVDSATHPSDLYVVRLARGETLLVNVEAPNSLGSIRLLGPESVSLGGNYELLETWRLDSTSGSFSFRASRDGPHYVWITANQSGQRYRLTAVVSGAGTQVIRDSVADIPGTELSDGAQQTFLVDVNDSPNAVFATDLCAGEALSVEIAAPDGVGRVLLLGPDSVTIGGGFDQLATWSLSGMTMTETYVAARDGTFYLWVRADDRAQVFTITVESDGNCVIG